MVGIRTLSRTERYAMVPLPPATYTAAATTTLISRTASRDYAPTGDFVAGRAGHGYVSCPATNTPSDS